MTILIFDLERGQYWKQNKFGYTSDLGEAGLFDYEAAEKILEDANIVNINTIIFNKDNMEKLTLPIAKARGFF